MAKAGIAKLFRNGRNQALRLPPEFRFEGTEVRVSKVAEGVLLQPMVSDTAEWFAKMDRLNGSSFVREGRNQPLTPRRVVSR